MCTDELSLKSILIGTGSAVFPLLSANQNPDLVLRAFEYSNHAVKLVQVSIIHIPETTSYDRGIDSHKASRRILCTSNLP